LGYPFYNYCDSKQYNAADQNWQTIQDKNGLIYVANGESLLQFDGESWKKIVIQNDPL